MSVSGQRTDIFPSAKIRTENDQLFPEEILDAGQKHLQANNIEHEIRTYSGVPHGQSSVLECQLLANAYCEGFAVVGDYQEAKIKEAQASAFDQMLAWLKTH